MKRKPFQWLVGLAVIAACIYAPTVINAAGRDYSTGPLEEDLNEETVVAIRNGLAYLKKTKTNSGSFGSRYPVACTSLAGMAFLAGGSGYLRGEYGEEVEAATKFLLDSADSWGFFNDGQSRMHGHGYATTFLAEVFGQMPDVVKKRAQLIIRKAIKVIRMAQTDDGGWGYYPKHGMQWGSNFDEASITVTMAQALRAARNAGFYVPKSCIDKAIDYVKRCATPHGFKYTLRRSGHTTYALAAAGVSVLNAAGVYESKELEMGLTFMRRQIAAMDTPTKASRFFYYGNLYAAQAMWQSSQEDWELWYPRSYRDLLNRQNSDGSWGGSNYGTAYSTAITLLVLEVPYQYLPLFQK